MTQPTHIPKESLNEKEPCCGSCLGEKEMGYGQDVDACCCKHWNVDNEIIEKELNKKDPREDWDEEDF